jgi:inner membrane protein
MNRKLLAKFLGVGVITLLLLIPLVMVEEQIAQRQDYQEGVEQEIAQTAASRQTLVGPVLAVRSRVQHPPKTEKDTKTGKVTIEREAPREYYKIVTADTLNIQGKASVEERYRGIYKAYLYHLDLALDGKFNIPADLLHMDPEAGKVLDANAVLFISVSDLRGIGASPEVKVGEDILRFAKPKDVKLDGALFGSRLEIELGELPLGKARQFDFAFPLQLMGMREFSVAPTAGTNTIRLASDWKNPSFQGRFLPRERHISAQGFDAEWVISSLNLNADPLAPNGENLLSVVFLDPVNIYLQSERATKYGILFVVLTFAAFFLWEILRRHPLHLAQYLLAGAALTLFFLLLIALSEHIAFLYAYLTAGIACIGLIVFYLSSVLGNRTQALAFGAGLVSLYGALYGILQSEDHALLMGSLLLFIALAAIMIATRRLNWYKLEITDPRGTAAKEKAPQET